MRNVQFILVLLALVVFPLACRAGENPAVPPAVSDGATCREIADLAKKYGVDRKLPDAALLEGKPCPGSEAAACLLSVIDRALEKCGKEGKDALSREDLDRIGALHEALKEELKKQEGYTTRREEIERMLARPETREFVYKYGAAGFLRSDIANNFHLDGNSFTPAHAEARLVYRVKPYVSWRPADWLDIHLEGQGYGFSGGSQEQNHISLYQGFVEAKLPGSDRLGLKGGRQELVYGSAFILGADSFFDGLTFDAGRLRIRPTDVLTIDMLGGAYAAPFANGVKGDLEGIYATYALAGGTAVEAYAFRDTGMTNSLNNGYLAIWGMRGTLKKGPLSLELEPVYETGKSFGESVNAYGGHVDLALETPVAGRTGRLFASYAYGSGGASNREFRNPNNDSSLVGDMNIIGDLSGITVSNHHASGLQIVTLGWGIDLTRDLNFSATGHYFVANETESGVSRNIGLETDFTATWAIAEGLSLIAGYDRFFTGAFFSGATHREIVIWPGGFTHRTLPGSNRNIDYGYLMLQFELSRSKPKMKPAKG